MVLTCVHQHCKIKPGHILGDGTSSRLFLVGCSKQYCFSLFPLVWSATGTPSTLSYKKSAPSFFVCIWDKNRPIHITQYSQGLREDCDSGLHTHSNGTETGAATSNGWWHLLAWSYAVCWAKGVVFQMQEAMREVLSQSLLHLRRTHAVNSTWRS